MPIPFSTKYLDSEFQPFKTLNSEGVFLCKEDGPQLGVYRDAKSDVVILWEKQKGSSPSVAAYVKDGKATLQLSATGKYDEVYVLPVEQVVALLKASGITPAR
jgi:hypothetical protein